MIHRNNNCGVCIVLSVILMAIPAMLHARACNTGDKRPPLSELSLEDLMNIEITSLGKKPESLSNAAAAIFVITHQDIKRSGVTSIADALRMAPGLHVSQLNTHAWAVSARGFNSFFANKMVVLRDGRNVYSSTYGGVYWDEQDMLLDDIERIEVIRGPAGTIWGANTVNGVINIISKCASDTQGGFLTAGIGKEDKAFIAYRYGGKLSNGHYRAYFKAHDYDGFADTRILDDQWKKIQGGFRSDFSISANTTLNISGDIYRQRNHSLNELDSLSDEEKITGANLLAKWQTQTTNGDHLSFQAYFDHTHRESDTIADITANTLDLDFQHRFNWGSSNEFTWGLGYKYTSDDIKDKPNIQFNPPGKNYDVITAFAQNQFRFFGDDLHVTVGSKFEHNDFTGTEIQPSIRAIWFPNNDFSIWASASHAVHTVSRAFTAVESTVFDNGILIAQFVGDENLDSEYADVLEFGIRGNRGGSFTWDAAFFYAQYDDLLDTVTLPPIAPNDPLPPFIFQTKGKNEAEATTKGIELSANWQPTHRFRLQTAYTYLDTDANSKDDPSFNINLEGRNPRHQLSIRPSFNLKKNVDLDFWLRYVDGLEYTLDGGATITKVDEHIGLDARIAWRPNKTMELSLVGQNLLEPEHVEFGQDLNNTHATSIERNIYLQLRWDIQ